MLGIRVVGFIHLGRIGTDPKDLTIGTKLVAQCVGTELLDVVLYLGRTSGRVITGLLRDKKGEAFSSEVCAGLLGPVSCLFPGGEGEEQGLLKPSSGTFDNHSCPTH